MPPPPQPTISLEVRALPCGVEIAAGGRAVQVDASAHVLRLTGPSGAARELGALRSALITAMDFTAQELGLAIHEHDLSPVGRALERALADAARAKGLYDRALEAAVAEVYPTPLIFSAKFLDSRWLWQDALRFRACRIAIANAEDDCIEDDSPATAEQVVSRLGKWRDLYAPEGKAKKALNQALNDFGESMPAAALWGLRRVPLSRPRRKQAHLALLGFLASLPGIEDIVEIVERAGDDELDDALLSEDGDPKKLAHVLVRGSAESTTLLQLLRSARAPLVVAAAEPERERGAFPPPPAPPPAVQGLRYIKNAAELAREGYDMHHCVARHTAACAGGKAFIFHIDRGDAKATVHVDSDGVVVEARGPCNRPSPAANFAVEVLGRWGVNLWLNRFKPETLCWPIGLEAPSGARPLRSVGAVHRAFLAISAREGEARLIPLRDWFLAATESAVEPRGMTPVGLMWPPDKDDLRVWAIDARGAVLGNTDGPLPGMVLRRWRAPRLFDARPRRPLVVFARPAMALPHGVQLVTDERALDLPGQHAFEARIRGDRPDLGRAARGEIFLFWVHPDAGSVLVEVEQATGAARALLRVDVAAEEIERAVEKLRRWGRAWALRAGPQRSTWRSPMPAPAGTEPLKTVDECSVLYQSLVDQRGDSTGALAAFFERHVAAAVRGEAWIVVRDRAEGLIAVIDAKRRIIARTDQIPR